MTGFHQPRARPFRGRSSPGFPTAASAQRQQTQRCPRSTPLAPCLSHTTLPCHPNYYQKCPVWRAQTVLVLARPAPPGAPHPLGACIAATPVPRHPRHAATPILPHNRAPGQPMRPSRPSTRGRPPGTPATALSGALALVPALHTPPRARPPVSPYRCTGSRGARIDTPGTTARGPTVPSTPSTPSSPRHPRSAFAWSVACNASGRSVETFCGEHYRQWRPTMHARGSMVPCIVSSVRYRIRLVRTRPWTLLAAGDQS